MHTFRPIEWFLFLILIMGWERAASQEMLGVMNSTYSGIDGAILNPASPVTSTYYLDVNVLSAHAFAENNYLYMDKKEYRFKRFLKTNPDFPTHPPDNKIYYDYYTTPDKKGYMNARLIGPSFALMMGKHAFGIYTDVRSATSGRNFSYELAKFLYEGLTFSPQYHINYIDDKRTSAANLEWAEVALNYSYVFKDRELDYWAFGVTLKDLMGYAGGYVTLDHLDYMVPDRDTLIVNTATGEAGIALPVDYTNNELLNTPLFKGKGFAFDLGLIFEEKLRSGSASGDFTTLCSQVWVPYRYKFGISLLDVGFIRFNKNALKAEIVDRGMIWPGINHSDFNNVNNLISQISSHFYGDTTQLIVDDKFIVGLPTGLSIQADMNIKGNWYANSTIMIPVKWMTPSVVRPALIAISPRYETRNFGAGMVASLYDWSKFRIGFNARYRWFFIGSEKIAAFFHFTDFTGIDLYAGIKISFLKGNCKSVSNENCGNNEYIKYRITKKQSSSLKFR